MGLYDDFQQNFSSNIERFTKYYNKVHDSKLRLIDVKQLMDYAKLKFSNKMADGGFMNDVYADGGELKGKFLAEIKVPYNYERVVKDEFEFTEFLSKKLTNNWFGNGYWGVTIVKPLFEKDYSQKIVVEIQIPVGVTQGGGLDKFDVEEFISKTLTKKWFGNGYWGVDIVSSYADGGELTNLKKGDRVLLKDGSGTKGATVTQDGLDSQKRARVRPDGFPFDISVTVEENNKTYVIKKLMSGGSYADGGMFEDNDGFMKADNNNNYRYPEMEVYVETLDEPIDLTNNVSSRTNQVVIMPLDEKMDLTDDNRVRARMGYEPKNRTPEKMMMVNQRMVIKDLPTPMSNSHKND
jgi:hypothetical protein